MGGPGQATSLRASVSWRREETLQSASRNLVQITHGVVIIDVQRCYFHCSNVWNTWGSVLPEWMSSESTALSYWLCKLTPWQLMLFCTTNASSPSYNLFLNETVHLSTSKTAIQAVRLFQPTNQQSNEWPCSGWINTPFNDIIVFVRDKGQLLVGPYTEGHAMFYLKQFVFLLRL